MYKRDVQIQLNFFILFELQEMFANEEYKTNGWSHNATTNLSYH